VSSVLDATAVLALVFGEAGAPRVRQAINEDAVISAVNLAEVVTRLIDQGVSAEDARQSMSHLGIDVVPLDAEAATRAGQLRSQARVAGLSLGIVVVSPWPSNVDYPR